MIVNAAVFALCLSLFLLAFRKLRTGQHRTALILILVAGLILRMFAASDRYLHTWDEKYHALVARNLIAHPLTPTLIDKPVLPYDPTNWTANHVWLEKGPVPLWAISCSLALFGTTELAVRVPSVLVSLFSVYLTFLIASALFGARTGVLAAFFHSINGLLIELPAGRVSSDHVEAFFVFFIELAVWLSIVYLGRSRRGYLALLIGVVTGTAVLCKWSPAFVVFPVWLTGLLWSKERQARQVLGAFALATTGCLLVIGPYLLYVHTQFPLEAAWVLRKYLGAFTSTLDQHPAPFYFYILKTGVIFGELIYVPLLLGLHDLVKRRADWKLALLTVWWLLPMLVFSLAETKRPTFLLISAPAFFVLLSHYWFQIYGHLQQGRLKARWAVYVLLTLLIALPVRYTIDRVTPFENRFRTPGWSADVKSLKDRLGAGDDVVVFNVEHNIEAMFYSGLTIYDFVPDEVTIRRVTRSGHRVVINDDGRLGSRIPVTAQVEVVRLSPAVGRE